MRRFIDKRNTNTVSRQLHLSEISSRAKRHYAICSNLHSLEVNMAPPAGSD